jgi:hypothetical protein
LPGLAAGLLGGAFGGVLPSISFPALPGYAFSVSTDSGSNPRQTVGSGPYALSAGCRWALAPIVVDEIFGFLGRLASEGHSLLIVEQYVSRALALADLVYLLVRGRLVFSGEPAEVAGTDIFTHCLGAKVAVAEVPELQDRRRSPL